MYATWLRRNLRFLLADLALAAAFAAVFLLTAPSWTESSPAARPVDLAGEVMLVATAAVLLIRRWFPVPALVCQSLVIGTFLAVGYPHGPYLGAYAVVGFTAGQRVSRRRGAILAAVVAVPVLAGEIAGYVGGWVDSDWRLFVGLAVMTAVSTVPIAVGVLSQEGRAFRERAEAESRRRLVESERLRMAREVHDVVGHSLSVISLQAGVALHVLDRRPEHAQAALEAIRRTSVEALDELRATLALTRASQDAAPGPLGRDEPAAAGTADAPGGPGAAGTTAADDRRRRAGAAGAGDPAGTVAARPPQPPRPAEGEPASRAPLTGLARLPGLVAQVRLCGVAVDVATSGPVDQLPADIDLAAYRIVQESLTNVLRHAGGARVSVRVDADPEAGTVELTVTDTPDPSARPAVARPAGLAAAGQGLTGLRERAQELGGRLSAGPHPDGGWRVHAVLPFAGRGRVPAVVAGRQGWVTEQREGQ